MGYNPDSGERSDEQGGSRGGRRLRAEVELGDTALRRRGEGLGRCYYGGVVFGWWLDEGETRGLLEFEQWLAMAMAVVGSEKSSLSSGE